MPHLQRHLAEHVDPLSSYMLLYQECSVVNLIEVCVGGGVLCAASAATLKAPG